MSSNSSVNVMAEERTFQCPDGVILAYRVYEGKSSDSDSSKPQESNRDDKKRRHVLCLHGWLDNAATFDLIAPNLVQKGYASEVVALDFPGHGLSGHKSNDGPVQVMAEYAYYVAEILRALGWNFETRKDTTTSTDGANNNINGAISHSPTSVLSLMGHSMGAGVAMMYTSAFPEQIDSLVLLEGFAPLARPATDASKHLRQAISTRLTYNPRLFPQYTSKGKQQNDKEQATAASSDTVTSSNSVNGNSVVNSGTSMGRIYPSIEVAIQSRQQTPRLCPGNQYMSYEAARRLVERATVPASTASTNETSDTKKPVRFRHDTRLNWPSLMYMGHEQVQSLLESVQTSKVPVCLLQAQDGWPVDNKAKHAVNDILKPSFLRSNIKGSHHFHVDPDNAPEVLDNISEFFDTVTISTAPASSDIEDTNDAATSTQSSSAL